MEETGVVPINDDISVGKFPNSFSENLLFTYALDCWSVS